MATTKQKQATLEQWAQAFPGYVALGGKFLLKRNGPLLSGICLDDMRNSETYRPTFFYHNLLIDWPVLTLNYGVRLRRRGVPLAINYGTLHEEQVLLMNQIEAVQHPESFEVFVRHIQATRNGQFGPIATYLPHVFRDVMSVGAYMGDAGFYISCIDAACQLISSEPNLNLYIIGSVQQWKGEIESLLASDFESIVQENTKKLRLPTLSIEPLF